MTWLIRVWARTPHRDVDLTRTYPGELTQAVAEAVCRALPRAA